MHFQEGPKLQTRLSRKCKNPLRAFWHETRRKLHIHIDVWRRFFNEKYETGNFQTSFISGGGGGTSILKVTGTCRWTGYDFAVINIGTGYLNRPNWLLADYSVYHRVASQGFPAGFPAHNVYDRPAISAPATRRCVRDVKDFYEYTLLGQN